MTKKIHDLIIIGAGPIGLACGIEAQNKNLDYLIFDKGCLVNSLPLSFKYDFFSLPLINLKLEVFLLFLIIQNQHALRPLSITEE